MTLDRRSFLRRTAALAVASPLAVAGACDDGREADGTREQALPQALLRPTLVPWSVDAVRMLDPSADRPLAYLSRGHRRVYIDMGQRDRAQVGLNAYISVSTGLWRIPRPGDDTRVPITPDDELREFEERDLWDWDPTESPAVGDVRLRTGVLHSRSVEVACVPLLPGAEWVQGERFDWPLLDGAPGEAFPEMFQEVARGTRHRERACAGNGDPVRIMAWSAAGVPPYIPSQ